MTGNKQCSFADWDIQKVVRQNTKLVPWNRERFVQAFAFLGDGKDLVETIDNGHCISHDVSRMISSVLSLGVPRHVLPPEPNNSMPSSVMTPPIWDELLWVETARFWRSSVPSWQHQRLNSDAQIK
jgi:hypothetical protein